MTPTTVKPWIERAAGWILGILALLQIFAFSTFVDREISWVYSFNFDQAVYLLRAYEDFELLLTKGIRAAVGSGLTAPVAGGGLYSLEAALLFSIFGASRKAALGLHMAHWLACQGMVFLAGRKIGNSAAWGLAGVGVLLALVAPMSIVGGLFDFRFDMPAMALIGILASILVLSDGFAVKKWSIWFGAVAFYAIWIRHLLLVYIGGGIALYGVFLLVVWMKCAGEEREALWQRLKNLTWGAMVAAGGVATVLAVKFEVLYNYYYVGHLIGAEKEVRAAMHGATGWKRYTFYLDSVIYDQMGLLAIGLLAVFCGWHLLSGILGKKPVGEPSWRFRGQVHAMAAIGAMAATAYLVLSYDIAKSPIVGNVFCVPLTLLAMLAARAATGRVDPGAYRRYETLSTGVALFVLTAGTLVTYQRYSLHSPMWAIKPEVEKVTAAHLQAGEIARKMPGGRAALFVDRSTDYQNSPSITVTNYERTGLLVHLDDPVGGNVMLSDWPTFAEYLKRADMALITEEKIPGQEAAAYPTTRMFDAHMEEIKQTARTEMTKTGEFQIGPHKVGFYRRPYIEIVGDSAGWLTSKGVIFRLQRQWLKGKKGLAVEGRTLHPEQVRGKLGGRAVVKGTGQALPIYFSAVTPDYRMEIDTAGLDSTAPGEVEIEVMFDRFWVPQKVNISADTRELVVSTPVRARLLAAPLLDWNR